MAFWRDTKDISGRAGNPKRVKADAYGYASDGDYSPEITKLKRILRFGLEAVTGRRVFLHPEFKRLMHAEKIINAYNSRQKSSNWVEWMQSNPLEAKVLNEAERLYAEAEQVLAEAERIHNAIDG